MTRKKKPKMGRPQLPEGAAHRIVFTMRVSAAEKQAIDAAATRAGKPTTRWAREILVERARE